MSCQPSAWGRLGPGGPGSTTGGPSAGVPSSGKVARDALKVKGERRCPLVKGRQVRDMRFPVLQSPRSMGTDTTQQLLSRRSPMSGRIGSRRSPRSWSRTRARRHRRTIEIARGGAGDRAGSARRRHRDRRFGRRAGGVARDRRDREASDMSRDRPPRRAGRRVHQRGGETGDLRLHRRRQRPGRAAELDRHRAPTVRRVSRPGGRVRASRRHRASEGHPDGASSASTSRRRSTCCAITRAGTNRKMVDVAEEITSTHQLLPGATRPAPTRSDDAE